MGTRRAPAWRRGSGGTLASRRERCRRISSGRFSSGTPASGFTRFTLVTRWSGDTVGRTFRSISTSLRSATDSGLGLTNPMGVAVCSRKSRNASGMVVVADGSSAMGPVARGAFAAAFFRLFFIAMEPPWMTEVANVRSWKTSRMRHLAHVLPQVSAGARAVQDYQD